MTPKKLFRSLATAEAITWATLLTGMVLKYGTETTDVGVRVGGMLHGVVFIAYCLVTVFVAVNQRWSISTTLLGLVSAIPPFFTVLFDWWAERRGKLTGPWRLGPCGETPRTLPERIVAGAIARPGRAVGIGILVVALLTGLALIVGPPASS